MVRVAFSRNSSLRFWKINSFMTVKWSPLLEIVTRLIQVLLENEEMRKLLIEVFCNMTPCTFVANCKGFEEI